MIDLPFCGPRHQQKGSALDPAPVAARRHDMAGLLSRRAAARHLSGVLAAVAMARLPHTTLAQPATPRPPVADVIFVGHTDNLNTLIAIVSHPGAPDVAAYLCDGHDMAIWYSGQITGTISTLEAGDGGSLSVIAAFSAINGTVKLADGRVLLLYVAVPAMGMGGLYDVTLNGDEMSGTGTSGQQLRGHSVETLPDGSELMAGTIELVDGSLRAFAAFISAGAEGDFRLIALNEGTIKGAAKPGQGTGWVNASTLGSGDTESG